jgi:hypothetical protein
MAAETLSHRLRDSPGARIVVDSLPAMSYYLDVEHAVYYHRGYSRFHSYSREHGRRDMWSGRRLLSTPEELSAYAEPAEEIWLVGSIDLVGRTDADLAAAALADGRLIEVGRDVLGQDKRIELVRLRHR